MDLSVVSGEASETDSEDEKFTKSNDLWEANQAAIQGSMITGEDSESDNDETAGKSNLKGENLENSDGTFNTARNKYTSLLHTKLRETNKDLYRDLDAFVNGKIVTGTENLNEIEQQLLRSQITLQGALTGLKAINNNSITIRNKLLDALGSQFFSNVISNT